MIEIAECANEAEKQLSLDVYNAVWPQEAVTMDEVASFEASLLGHHDLLARVDGVLAGSAHAALTPWRPDRLFLLLTVLPAQRGRGAGSALYAAASEWARAQGHETIEAVVAENDSESLAFANRRGFVEERRERGVMLDLTQTEPPAVVLPAGVEIVTWADRPELDRGMYEVAVEAYPDIPGNEDEVARVLRGMARPAHAGLRRPARGDVHRPRRR